MVTKAGCEPVADWQLLAVQLIRTSGINIARPLPASSAQPTKATLTNAATAAKAFESFVFILRIAHLLMACHDLGKLS